MSSTLPLFLFIILLFAGLACIKGRLPGPRSWVLNTRGQGLTEYALLLAFVVLVVIGVLSVMGTEVKAAYEKVSCTLAGGVYHEDEGEGKSNRCKKKKKSVEQHSTRTYNLSWFVQQK